MLSNILFILLVLLLTSAGPELRNTPWVQDPLEAWNYSLVLFGFLLLMIYAQRRYRSRDFRVQLAQVELIFFLAIYYLILGGDRLVGFLPSIIFYLAAFTYANYLNSKTSAIRELRLTIPFLIPFVLLMTLPLNEWGLVLVIVLGLVFLPPIMMKIWKCTPLRKGELKERLEALCEKAHFKHGGIMNWKIMDHALTAAILGIVPRFRYILFTPKILKALSPEALEAILAHEIGHSQRKHLLIYPFILFGMGVTMSYAELGLHNPFLIFLTYAIVMAGYFRIVFGYYSRLFERQADLHVLKLGIPISSMVKALDQVGILSGHSHDIPSWHHFSIRERIDFLNEVEAHPPLAEKHHRKVFWSVIGFFAILSLATGFLYA